MAIKIARGINYRWTGAIYIYHMSHILYKATQGTSSYRRTVIVVAPLRSLALRVAVIDLCRPRFQILHGASYASNVFLMSSIVRRLVFCTVSHQVLKLVSSGNVSVGFIPVCVFIENRIYKEKVNVGVYGWKDDCRKRCGHTRSVNRHYSRTLMHHPRLTKLQATENTELRPQLFGWG